MREKEGEREREKEGERDREKERERERPEQRHHYKRTIEVKADLSFNKTNFFFCHESSISNPFKKNFPPF